MGNLPDQERVRRVRDKFLAQVCPDALVRGLNPDTPS